MLDHIHQVCLSHFLCEFDPRSKKRKTVDIVRSVAQRYFSDEKVEEFIDDRMSELQRSLVEEFNVRYTNHAPLRFQIADASGIGVIVEGNRSPKLAKEIKFQDALHRLSAAEFERLAAVILKLLGCHQVFSTPSSHDQGVDAFGYQSLLPPMPYGIAHSAVWIAQAKHYLASTVTTGNIRELVGSKELLLAKVFSTVDERYKQLNLKSYAPIVLALITTEEIPATVRRLAEGAGVFVLAASDLFHILSSHIKTGATGHIRKLILKIGKSIPTLE